MTPTQKIDLFTAIALAGLVVAVILFILFATVYVIVR